MFRLDRIQHECEDAIVITERMLIDAVRATLPKKDLEVIETAREFLYEKVPYIRLNYCHIMVVQHLERLTNLVKLELNNNMIERISGLSHMTSLKYLDLSFNNIEKIEGLGGLVWLEELSLFQNKISILENMDDCTELIFLSVGRNSLSNLEETILYLRKFQKLRSINLMDNPLCNEPGYKTYVLALCDNLYYLDYYKVNTLEKDKADKEHAVLKYNLTTSEAKEAERREQQQRDEERLESYKCAFVDHFHDDILFDMMMKSDPESRIYQAIPGIEEHLEALKQRMAEMCAELFRLGFENYNRRNEERVEFEKCVEKTLDNIRWKSYQVTEEFINFKNDLEDEIRTDYMGVNDEQSIASYESKLKALEKALLKLEAFLIDQIDELEKDFERNLREISTPTIEHTQHQFSQMREYMEEYYTTLTDQCESARKRLDTLFGDDVATRKHFVDKDSIINLISSSREVNMLVIDAEEDRFLTAINEWIDTTMEEIHIRLDEDRNRKAVLEITRMMENYSDALAVMFPQTMLI